MANFNGDGMDGEMLADTARKLASIVEIAEPGIERLFDKPANDDIIRIGAILFRPDPETRLLVPTRKLDPDESAENADTHFLWLIHQALARVTSVSREGVEHAIDTLILMLPEDEREADRREIAQYIADHRFARLLAVAAG